MKRQLSEKEVPKEVCQIEIDLSSGETESENVSEIFEISEKHPKLKIPSLNCDHFHLNFNNNMEAISPKPPEPVVEVSDVSPLALPPLPPPLPPQLPPPLPPLSSPSSPKPSTSDGKPQSLIREPMDSEALFQKYFKTFRDRMNAFNANTDEIQEEVQKLEDIHQKVKTFNRKFQDSRQFGKLMQVFTEEIGEMSSQTKVVRHHTDLGIELNRFAHKPEKKSADKVKNKNKKVKALTATIKKLQIQITAAEREEIDLNDLDNESSFTNLPKLYRKIQEVWAAREELLRNSTFTGRVMFKKYRCNSTPYPEINKCVETLFNSHLKKIRDRDTKGYVDESFTFIDVRKAILNVIEEKKLVIMNTESMIEEIYTDLLKVKRKRREQDSEDMIDALEELEDLKPEGFVENPVEDPALELELAKNKKLFEQRIDDLFEKYTKEDRKKNGETVLVNGSSEWDTDLVNGNEEFESLDVKDGDLEDDNNEEESDEDLDIPVAPIPDFSTNEVNGETAPEPKVPSIVSESIVSEPIVSEPIVSEPIASEPIVSEPIVSEPIASKSIASEPMVSEPIVIKPEEPEVITICDDDSSDSSDEIIILS